MRIRLHLGSVLACLACSETVSARLEVRPDTLSLYGRDYSWVTVNQVDNTRRSEARGAVLTARDTSIVRTSGTSLACLREGTTTVDVVAGQLTTAFVAQCQFATRLEVESYLTLESGGAPHSLDAIAIFSSGTAKVLPAISARVNDTTIAVVRDGAVVPVAIGRVGLRIDYGGIWSRMGVEIRRTISNDTVTVAPGETRNWMLDPGRYTITVRVNSRPDLNILEMHTEGLRCSRDSRDEDTIYCIADAQAEVSFGNTRKGGTVRTGRAFVRIVQTR